MDHKYNYIRLFTLYLSFLQVSSPRTSHTTDILKNFKNFRPFNMVGVDNVSILFADIVGFTRMSSNKVRSEFLLMGHIYISILLFICI